MRVSLVPATSVALVSFCLWPALAHASLFGEENGPLTALVAQGVAQINQAAQTFAQLKQTYDETRKYVGLAQDAVNGFKEFGAFSDSVFRNPGNALATAFPDAAALSRDLSSPASWGAGTGELQRLVKVCLSEGRCVAFREAVTARQARESISKTFGTSPIMRDDIETIDVEASKSIRDSMVQGSKSAVAGEQARALMRKCTSGTDNQAVAACQAAANLGQLLQLEQTAALNEQVAESNRLQALELASKNSERKRELREVLRRQRMLEAGSENMAPPAMRFTAPADDTGGLR